MHEKECCLLPPLIRTRLWRGTHLWCWDAWKGSWLPPLVHAPFACNGVHACMEGRDAFVTSPLDPNSERDKGRKRDPPAVLSGCEAELAAPQLVHGHAGMEERDVNVTSPVHVDDIHHASGGGTQTRCSWSRFPLKPRGSRGRKRWRTAG